MNKSQIKQQVEAKTEKHIPKAINEVARSKAYSAVHDALYEGPKNIDHEAAPPSGTHPSKEVCTVVRSDDPRMTGSAPIPARGDNHQ